MDALVSEVVIVLDKAFEEKLKEAVKILQDHGVSILSADDDNSVVEGTVDAHKVHELEKLDCVDYVRKVFTYEANYPPGDPRDIDHM
jgi:hypothetical protein